MTYADKSRGWVPLPSSIGLEQRDQAKALAAELALRARERLPPSGRAAAEAPPSETVAAYADRWIAERVRRGLRSVRDDRIRLDLHVLPVIGTKGIRDVDAKDLRAVVASLDTKAQSGALATSTARKVWGTAAKMFDDACRAKVEVLRVRDNNPARDVRPPDVGHAKAKAYLYPSELLALVSCERILLRWRRVYALAVYTYARAGELEALHVEDVDLEHGALHIHRAADPRTGELRETKTGETRRVPIEPTLRPLLEVLVRGRVSSARVVDMPAREEGAYNLRLHLRRAGVDRPELFADDATRTPLTFHDLRATGITWRAVRGDDPLKIQRHAGHSDLNTTQRYIREASVFADGFGEVFPELPASLFGDSLPPDAGAGEGGDGSRSKVPATSARATRGGGRKSTAPGAAGTDQGTGGGVQGESVEFSRLSRAAERPLFPPTRDDAANSGVISSDAHPDDPSKRTAEGSKRGGLDQFCTGPRGDLLRALGEAVRAGLEGGDALLVRVAAAALAELSASR